MASGETGRYLIFVIPLSCHIAMSHGVRAGRSEGPFTPGNRIPDRPARPTRRTSIPRDHATTNPIKMVIKMNWNQAKGNWNQFMGKAKAKWGDLTDDELTQIAGERDALVGLIQTKYGILQEAAEEQVKEWEKGHEVKDWESSHS